MQILYNQRSGCRLYNHLQWDARGILTGELVQLTQVSAFIYFQTGALLHRGEHKKCNFKLLSCHFYLGGGLGWQRKLTKVQFNSVCLGLSLGLCFVDKSLTETIVAQFTKVQFNSGCLSLSSGFFVDKNLLATRVAAS